MIITILLSIMIQTNIIFNFSKNSSISDWQIINDNVMGGRSEGFVNINTEGHIVFYGTIRLDNNGGFTLVRNQCDLNIPPNTKGISLRVFGDGKTYQLRLKSNTRDRHAYTKSFSTEKNCWQVINILFIGMSPTFRGQELDLQPFSSASIKEVAFLVANKRTEDFKLQIDSMSWY